MVKIQIIETRHGIIKKYPELFGLSEYIKKVNKKEHFFNRYQGYAISTSELELMKEHAVNIIKIIEDNERIYATTYDEWMKKSEIWNNQGDIQRALEITKMVLIGQKKE